MVIVHHHLLYQAKVGRNDLGKESEKELEKFLYDLLEVIDMNCLIPAALKFSHQKAWTGIVGVIKKGKHKIRVPVQDIELKDKKVKYAEWLDAYRHWLG